MTILMQQWQANLEKEAFKRGDHIPHAWQVIFDDGMDGCMPKGFYAMGNGGIPNLVYANWANDKKFAAKEFNFRFKNIEKVFYKDGYINNNSFRGYRGLWYHSYGLNSALGYIYLAKYVIFD